MVLALAACGGDSATPPPPPEPPRPVAVSVSPDAVVLDHLGATASFTATITDQYGATYPGAVTWSSSDPNVVRAEAGGLVTAVANGAATVVATFQSLSDSATATVRQLPASVEVASGDGQEGRPGRLLADDVVVRVADGGDSPVEGTEVAFAGDGTVEPASAVSDTAGLARTAWTLGDAEGAQVLTAAVAEGPSVQITATAERPRPAAVSVAPDAVVLDHLGATASFTATITDQYGATYPGAATWSSSDPNVVRAGAGGLVTAVASGAATVVATFQSLSDSATATVRQLPASVEVVSGDGQEGRPGRLLADEVVVRVADGGGSPIEGTEVAFAGDGTVEPASAVSDTAGLARTAWTLGDAEGAQALTAAVAEGPSVQITATAERPRPVAVSVSPDAVVLDHLGATASFTATITDQYGATYPDAVTWSSSDPNVVRAEAGGLVTAIANGAATVVATFQSLSDSATATVRQLPASVEVVSGDGQEGRPGRLLADEVVVRVADGGGSPIEGTEVAFAGDGTVEPASAVSDTAGLARTAWTLGDAEGAQVLTAAVAEGPSVQITATAERLPVVSLAATAASAPEGATIELAIEAIPAPKSPILVAYSLASDDDATTADADTADYNGGPTGAVEIAPGQATGVVRIAVVDDDQIEATREALVVALDIPEESDGYQLGAQVSATATILEGVCDRTPQLRDEIARLAGTSGDCTSVTDERLLELRELRVRGPEDPSGGDASLTSLKANDFRGLAGLRHLELAANRLSSLPDGVFAGLVALEELDLSGNRIAELSAEAFAGLGKLRRIDFHDNGLAELPRHLLADAGEVEEVHFGGNLVEALPDSFFAGAPGVAHVGLERNRIASLPPGAFRDLPGLSVLRLERNRIDELPPGFFEGTADLTEVRLERNPGAPFPLAIELERTDTANLLAPGPATIAMSVAGGTPFEVAVAVGVRNGLPSTTAFAIAAGRSRSAEVVVTQASGSREPTQVEMTNVPAVPNGFSGLEVRSGASLVLFAKPDNDAPQAQGTVLDHVLQAGGSVVRWDAEPYFTDDDAELTYSASSSDGSVVHAEADGQQIELTGLREGAAAVTVTATDPWGLRASHRFVAAVVRAPDTATFEIDLLFGDGFSLAQRRVLERAARRWQSVVTGDLPEIPLNDNWPCFGDRRYALNVDDVLIFAFVAEIDDEGGVLAWARPCVVRRASNLPVVGALEFDSSDLEALGDGLFTAALHEMGHVLGIGSLWDWHGFLENPSLPDNPGADTHFDGPRAVEAFDAVGGFSYPYAKVPVENMASAGSSDAHWRFSVFGPELMNPFLYRDRLNPLSAVTVQSLADMGYAVDLGQADSYALPGISGDAERGLEPADRIMELRGDVRDGPIVVVGEDGRVLRVIRR